MKQTYLINIGPLLSCICPTLLEWQS